MLLGCLDVGRNPVHLLVVGAPQGPPPLPAFSHKAEFRLGEHLDATNRLTEQSAVQLRDFVNEALRIAEDKGVQEVLAWIKEETLVDIQVLPGADESRLTFLAARRWFGWSSGRLLLLDIGGGAPGIAAGQQQEPGRAV